MFSARCWFGQITNQTLNHMIVPSHMPMPMIRMRGRSEAAADRRYRGYRPDRPPSQVVVERREQQPKHDGRHRAPAEPVKRGRRDERPSAGFSSSGNLRHHRGRDEVEIPEQTDPHHAGCDVRIGLPLLAELDGNAAVTEVRGMARRPFDPGREGWSRVSYRRGDVVGRDSLALLFDGAQVAVHLAFAIFGSREETRRVNLEGSRSLACGCCRHSWERTSAGTRAVPADYPHRRRRRRRWSTRPRL